VQWNSFDGADYKHLKLFFFSELTTGETSSSTNSRQNLHKLLLIMLKIDFVNTLHSLLFKTHNLDTFLGCRSGFYLLCVGVLSTAGECSTCH